MSSPNSDDEASEPATPSPRRTGGGRQSECKDNAPPTTPVRDSNKLKAGSPQSAPAPVKHVASGGAARARANTTKAQPTLLGDFLLGRQTPARVAANRRKALDAAAVKAEMRAEMRQAAVRKVPQPGGVKDRVKQWQKANAAAMANGDPEEAPTEPGEVPDLDEESVTEKDRMRVKLRQAHRSSKGKSPASSAERTEKKGAESDHDDGDGDPEGVDPSQQEQETAAVPADHLGEGKKPTAPPKKRIVSDEHWKKQRGAKTPQKTPGPKAGGSPSAIPKDFLQRTAQNPSVKSKIKDWAMRVEIPETAATQSHEPAEWDIMVDEEDPTSARTGGDEANVKRYRTKQPKHNSDDGIRIIPIKDEEDQNGEARNSARKQRITEQDGIRITPLKTKLPDDGIRVRPLRDSSTGHKSVPCASVRLPSVDGTTKDSSTMEGHSWGGLHDANASETEVQTPTRKPRSARRAQKGSRPPTMVTGMTESQTNEKLDEQSGSEEPHSARQQEDNHDHRSDKDSDAQTKSLADIPFGFSAFSELDLPVGSDARQLRHSKTQRNTNFKAVPNVFKKVVSEGKKIIQEKVDPPKPVANHPPSIEKWLNNTVDPFVEAPVPKEGSLEKEWVKDARKRSVSETRVPRPKDDSTIVESTALTEETEQKEDQELVHPTKSEDKEEAKAPKESKTHTPPSTGLKRRRATRSASSPLKAGECKPRLFRDLFKDAFKGQSDGHKLPPATYQSFETNRDYESPSEDDESEDMETRARTSGSPKRSPSPESTFYAEETPVVSSDPSLPRPRPPTNGFHELSTIVSEEVSSIHESDAASSLSHTTVTQTTALTKASDVSRHRSHKSGAGLKRHLTKHSDLISVLSLPEDGRVPARRTSSRANRDLRRKTSKPDTATIDDLLKEFSEDENIYQKELKTIVDGVVPVLLRQVVQSDKRTSRDLLSTDEGIDKPEVMTKVVVSMGIPLEQLRIYHKRAPLHDIHQLLSWLDNVHSVYDSYLDAWRLCFQGLVVNLAPALESKDDEDSLVNGMPRNEDGDVLDSNGERVDVAHLMKRPLVRIRLLLKLAKGARAVLGLTHGHQSRVEKFEKLHTKARQRYKEELARKADEDANSTDTTRTRNLRNLAPMESVVIDQSRQVNAKDWFSLDLAHSSGQRLECQVELVFRDKLDDLGDKGDILVREMGSRGRTWLLFPPVPVEYISARKGDGTNTLIVMVRGTHNGRDWYELFAISAECAETVDDWLDILGTTPRPPSTSRAQNEQSPSTPRTVDQDVPVGERRLQSGAQSSPLAPKTTPSRENRTSPQTPSRYHSRKTSSTPSHSSLVASLSPSSDDTVTQSEYLKSAPRLSTAETPSRSLKENLRPQPEAPKRPSPNTTPYREDGAPPPPVHRNLGPKLSSPVDLSASSRVKRRTSSPLKHEYHPSDMSSTSEASGSDSSASESESSSSDLEDDEESCVPETVPGISIKQADASPVRSMVSENSLTPFNSASQAGLAGHSPAESDPTIKFIASISYWSNKRGMWKELWHEACSTFITPGLMEVHPLNAAQSVQQRGQLQSLDTSDPPDYGAVRPLIALDLTPLVMIRQSTVIDLEIRSPVRSYSKLNKIDAGIFRFRSPSPAEGSNFYMAVHSSRMNNAKFKALEEEARFRSFGQSQPPAEADGQSSSSRPSSWFGRRNSYRASTRAPSQSQGSSSSISATSLFKRLTGGNLAFSIENSFLDKQSSRTGSGGGASLYTTSASSSGGDPTPPRSPSVSLAESGGRSGVKPLGSDRLKIRLHMMVPGNRWEDHGNCHLQISRPPPGMKQELRLYHGMEKRIIVTSISKKEAEKATILLDVVLGSGCFSRLGNRGICLNVWEDVRDEHNVVGAVPASGASSGRVRKWCIQCSSTAEASWIFGLVAQEVVLS